MKKPVINETLCIRCGNCAWTCSDVFEQEVTGEMPKVKKKDDYSQWQDKIEEAIQLCPAQAISWQEAEEKTE